MKYFLISTHTNQNVSTTESAIKQFTDILYEVADRSLRNRKVIKKKSIRQKWFDLSCAKLGRECKQLGRKLQKNINDMALRAAFFTTRKKYKQLLRKTKREFKAAIINKLENCYEKNPSEYWKLVDQLKGIHGNTQRNDAIPPNTWYSYFKGLLSTPPDISNSEHERRILRELDKLEKQKCFNELNFKIDESEIIQVLKKLKPGKAVASDGIANEMLRAGAVSFSGPLTCILNKIFTSGMYPKKWGEGVITAIYKAGKMSLPENYRGITICSNLAKVYSSVLNSRLVKFIEDRKIRAKEQIGFIKKARTADHMFVLKSLIDKYTKPKAGKLFACFVDFSKAFDTVWWQGLYFKLLKLGIAGNFFKTIKNMYSSMTSCVKTSAGLSPPFGMSQGVRQGEVLSPTLFNLYINDLPHAITKGSCDLVNLGGESILCLMYADDIVLLSTSRVGLQKSLNNLYNYCNDWKLKVNMSKTKAIIFNKSGRLMSQKLDFGQTTVECVKSYKYLGIDFDNRGSFTSAVENLRIKAMKACFKLKTIIGSNNLSPKVALGLFNTLVKPIALYGCEVWGPSLCANSIAKTLSHFESLPTEKVQLSFARFILGVNRHTTTAAVRGELGLFPIALSAMKCLSSYKGHIMQAEDDTLLASARNSLSISNVQSTNQSNWWAPVERHFSEMGDQGENSNLFLSYYENEYRLKWQTAMQTNEGKLRSYALFKHNFAYENYLDIVSNIKHRNALTRLRTSSHNLMIETGRYIRPKIPISDRLCVTCKEIEDECHFLIQCRIFHEERNHLFTTIEKLCPLFSNLNPTNKMLYLLAAEGETIKETAKFCHTAMEKRKNIIRPIS